MLGRLNQNLILLVFATGWLAACANSGEKVADNPSQEEPLGEVPTPIPPDGSSSDASFETGGVLRFTIEQEDLVETVQAYLVGFAETHLAFRESANSSNFIIRGVKSGSYDFMITAVDPQTVGSDAPSFFGLRINGLKISDSTPLKLSQLSLSPSHTIRGQIFSKDGPLASANLEINGTNLTATSDANGDFTIRGVPPGHHRIVAGKDGFHNGRIELFQIETKDTSSDITLDPITLWDRSVSSPGVYSRASEIPESELKVTFVSLAPESANMMRFGEQADLSNVAWQALVSSFDYTFATPGSKTLFIQFSRNESQLSTVFSQDVLIELQP